MIDRDRLSAVIEGYKGHFPSHWRDEMYKWKAVRHFQDHWDIDATDFGDMFEEATRRTGKLLGSGYTFPRRVIVYFAAADGKATRAMFRALFDEERPLEDRVEAFKATSDELLSRYDDGTWKKHDQRTDAISTYLWLKFPDKYHIYKYESCRALAKELRSDAPLRRDGSAASMLAGYRMLDEVCAVLQGDQGLREMLTSSLTNDCWPDPQLKTLTTDLSYYVSRSYGRDAADPWFPPEDLYSPGLSVEEWVALLKDETVFDQSALEIMKRMKDCDGQASCKQLSNKYGQSSNFYNANSFSVAKRVAEETRCPVMQHEDGSRKRWWTILYLGRGAKSQEEGSYLWKLRDELSQALDQVDLSGVALYASQTGLEYDTIDYETGGMPEAEATPCVKEYTKADFLAEVYMEEGRYDALVRRIERKKNVILQGPPGVGKTFAANRLAWSIMGERDDSRAAFVQFHQNYAYEDFVWGYKPDGEGFAPKDGVFLKFCERASKAPGKKHFFIIDEINRGNLSRIFGELLMLIEEGYRGEPVTLASGRTFAVPEDLYLIGLMNTADRSLAMIDYALRRRFSFFDMEPGFGSDGFMDYQRGLESEVFDDLIEQIQALNRAIVNDPSLGKGFRIGHSYFCGLTPESCTEDLRAIVEFDILPTLEEYWFDDRDKLLDWQGRLEGAFRDE